MNYELQEKGCSVRLPLPLLRGERWADSRILLRLALFSFRDKRTS